MTEDDIVRPDQVGAIRMVLAGLNRDAGAIDVVLATADPYELVSGLTLLAMELAQMVYGSRAPDLLALLLFDPETDTCGTGDRYWAAELDHLTAASPGSRPAGRPAEA